MHGCGKETLAKAKQINLEFFTEFINHNITEIMCISRPKFLVKKTDVLFTGGSLCPVNF